VVDHGAVVAQVLLVVLGLAAGSQLDGFESLAPSMMITLTTALAPAFETKSVAAVYS